MSDMTEEQAALAWAREYIARTDYPNNQEQIRGLIDVIDSLLARVSSPASEPPAIALLREFAGFDPYEQEGPFRERGDK